VLRKAALMGASLGLAALLSFGLGATSASANKVDCSKVMAERNAGKKAKDIAKEMKISTSSVYRCKEKMAKSTSASAKPGAVASPASKASPAAK
jgi:transposase